MIYQRYVKRITFILVMMILIAGVLTLQAQSQETRGNHYTLHAGLSGQGNIRFLSFVPIKLQIHRGDTITWVFGGGLHNVRFTEQIEWTSFFTPLEVDGTEHLIFDPRLSYRTVASGEAFTGEPLNSGIAFDIDHSQHLFDAEAPYSYSIVVEAEPGVYSYLCDLHPGMVGYIEVVGEDVEILSPVEVSQQISDHVAAALEEATAQMYAHEEQHATTTEDGTLEITAGVEFNTAEIHVAIDRFFPATAVIHAGESVTWSLDANATVAHVIVSPYLGFQEYTSVIEDAEGNKQLAFSPLGMMPTIANGQWDRDAEYVNAGIVLPGQSITVTFPEPGVYQYSDVFEPGMTGTIVVLE